METINERRKLKNVKTNDVKRLCPPTLILRQVRIKHLLLSHLEKDENEENLMFHLQGKRVQTLLGLS